MEYLFQVSGFYQPLQLHIEPLHGQPHNIVERPFDTLDADISYPLLYAVSPRLIHWAVLFDIVRNLLVLEQTESNQTLCREGYALCCCAERNARYDFVCRSRQGLQHSLGIGPILRLAENFSTGNNHRIGSQQYIALGESLWVGFAF